MPFLIDGHNLLKWLQKNSECVEPLSDVQLCHTLGRYLKLIGEKGQIVFDGTGPPEKGRFDNIPNLEVSFAGHGTDADGIIEGKIEISTAPRGLTVVSSDRRLRAAARMRRATPVRVQEFWADLCRRLSKTRKRISEPSGKRWGLTESETEQWLRFFGLD